MLGPWASWQAAITIGNNWYVSNINMFQSLWSSAKRDACEERFLEKWQKGVWTG